MSAVPATLQDLLSRLAYVELYAIFMQPTGDFQTAETVEGAAALTEHLEYLFELQGRGQLLAAGPLDLSESGGRFEGVCIVKAESLRAAEDIAAAEPYCRKGWRTNTVRSWHVNEGVLIPSIRTATEHTSPT
ncbi:YciI family protein [Mycobacterium sp. NPDC003449]